MRYSIRGGKKSVIDFFIYFIGTFVIEMFIVQLIPDEFFFRQGRKGGYFLILFALPMIVYWYSTKGYMELSYSHILAKAHIRRPVRIPKEQIRSMELRTSHVEVLPGIYLNVTLHDGSFYYFNLDKKTDSAALEKELDSFHYTYKKI